MIIRISNSGKNPKKLEIRHTKYIIIILQNFKIFLYKLIYYINIKYKH